MTCCKETSGTAASLPILPARRLPRRATRTRQITQGPRGEAYEVQFVNGTGEAELYKDGILLGVCESPADGRLAARVDIAATLDIARDSDSFKYMDLNWRTYPCP